MVLRVEKIGDVTVVALLGELDASNVPQFKRHIAPVFEASSKVVFDVGQLQFIDSSGLGAILSCLRQVNAAGGDLKLCGVTKPVATVFGLIRLNKICEILPDREQAVAAFGRQGGG